MSHILNEMEIADISPEEINKLQDAEKAINSIGGGEEVYLLALKRRGR